MLDPERRFELENKLIDVLYGRLHLLQDYAQKARIVSDGLKTLFSGDDKGVFKK